MNLQQLGYFVAVARSRNFTRAAETCFVAQPALSQQIRKLEQELGLPVFERHRRGVGLTVAGAAFLAYAEQVLKLVDEGKQRVSDLGKVRHGTITVVCLPTIATYWLPQIISKYRRAYPEVEVQIQERVGCTPEDFCNAIADVGIVQLDEEPAARSSKLVQLERLFVDDLVLVVPKGHRLSTQASDADAVPLREVAAEAFVLPKAACGMGRVILRAFAEAGIQPRVRLETSQVEAVCEMVSAGLGVGLMPSLAMNRPYANISWRRVSKPVPKRTIALARPANHTLSPAVDAFLRITREAARDGNASAVARAGASRKVSGGAKRRLATPRGQSVVG